jgi:hypothetical protein
MAALSASSSCLRFGSVSLAAKPAPAGFRLQGIWARTHDAPNKPVSDTPTYPLARSTDCADWQTSPSISYSHWLLEATCGRPRRTTKGTLRHGPWAQTPWAE